MNKIVKSKITFSVNYSFPGNSKDKKCLILFIFTNDVIGYLYNLYF